jgi:sensor histidine kinase YesM
MIQFSKYIKPIFIVAVGIYLFDQIRIWIAGGQFGDFTVELEKFSVYFLYSFVIGSANIWLVKKLDILFPWKEIPRKRVVYGVVGAVVVSMISIAVLRVFTVLILERNTWQYFVENESVFVYFYSLIITLVVVLVFYVINFYKSITKQTIRQHQVVAKTETAKYETLKSQLDPHFLFNSLNVLTSLIEENPEKAENFTTKLSKVYRYVLEQKDKDLVLLSEELVFAKNYMELLQMRFEGALQFELPRQISNPDFKVVPLALQMLLENTVKHNKITTGNPLIIKITEEEGFLQVVNNFSEKESIAEGSGIGLKNIIERYALLTKRKVEIIMSADSFSVKIPLLTQKTNLLTMTQDKEKSYIEAREQVERIKEFYTGLISYLIVMPVLVFINYKTYWAYKWFIYPMFGWGIGLIFSYFKTFNQNFVLGSSWEKRKIEEIMEGEKKQFWE